MKRRKLTFALGMPLVICAVVIICAGSLLAGTEKVLYTFQGGSDAASPYGPLTFDKAGNLYGTSLNGGATCNYSGGCGAVFELQHSKTGWTENVIYAFTGGADGRASASGVTFDKQGNAYAASESDGNPGCYDGGGCGAVIELTPSGGNWTETTIHTFNNSEGGGTISPLVIDSMGNLYGTGYWGGLSGCFFGCGTIFELSPSSGGLWTEKTLYEFTNGADGATPVSTQLLYKRDLYGIAVPPDGAGGANVVFELKHTGSEWQDESIYTFPDRADGNSWVGVVFDSAGNIYGVTLAGGTSGAGSVYKMTQSSGVWTLTTLYSFTGGADGGTVWAPVTLDKFGNIYGTTRSGGLGYGVVFELQNSGGAYTYKTLYSFTGGADGSQPVAPVTFRGGRLYGTTGAGGTSGVGVMYEITP
jgi:hypothetical protein